MNPKAEALKERTFQFALDVIAYFETPYDHHIGAGFSCDWGPF